MASSLSSPSCETSSVLGINHPRPNCVGPGRGLRGLRGLPGDLFPAFCALLGGVTEEGRADMAEGVAPITLLGDLFFWRAGEREETLGFCPGVGVNGEGRTISRGSEGEGERAMCWALSELRGSRGSKLHSGLLPGLVPRRGRFAAGKRPSGLGLSDTRGPSQFSSFSSSSPSSSSPRDTCMASADVPMSAGTCSSSSSSERHKERTHSEYILQNLDFIHTFRPVHYNYPVYSFTAHFTISGNT